MLAGPLVDDPVLDDPVLVGPVLDGTAAADRGAAFLARRAALIEVVLSSVGRSGAVVTSDTAAPSPALALLAAFSLRKLS